MIQQVPSEKLFFRILPFFIVIIIDAMSIGMVIPILTPLVFKPSGMLALYSSEARHILFGVILAVGPLGFMLGAPILGYLSDSFGRKKILLICLLGTLISFVFYAFSFYFNLLFLVIVARLIDGLTSGSQGVAIAAITDISDHKNKAANIGFIAVAMTIGLVVGPFIGGFLSDKSIMPWFTDSTPFYFAIGLGLFNLLVFFAFLKETTHHRQPLQLSRFFSQLSALFQQKTVRLLLLTFFLFELAWSLYFQSISLVLAKEFHYSKHLLGLFSAYIGLVLSLGLIYLVRFMINRFSLMNNVIAALFCGSMALLSLTMLSTLSLQWILGAIIALAVAVAYSCLIAQASNLTSKQQQGFLLGTTDGVLALAFAISGMLAGTLSYINIHLPSLVAGGCMLAGGALLLFNLPQRKIIPA